MSVATGPSLTRSSAAGHRYARLVLPQLARARALQDANPASPTCGCCDRNYWKYKTLTSYPSAPFQQLAWPFALLATHPPTDLSSADAVDLRRRAIAAARFWCQCQHPDGSCDEWYRNEHSYCPTAFTTLAMAQTLLLLREHISAADCDHIITHLNRAADWLAPRFNPEVMNQNLAATAAAWSLHRLTGDPRCREQATATWQRTLTHFDDEGWFLEYGGADLGYTTLALDLLAVLHRDQFPADVLGTSAKTCDFLATFPAGDLAGGLGSRGTEHNFPFGVEYFAYHHASARTVAARLRVAFDADLLRTPASADDRYLAYFYLPQFALAATLELADLPDAPAPADVHHEHSGLALYHLPGGDIVCALRRQGAFNLITPDNQLCRNFGYWIETVGRSCWTTCRYNPDALDIEALPNSTGWTIRGSLARVADELPLAGGAALFHAFCEHVLRWPRLAEWAQQRIKARKITKREDVPLTFERTIRRVDGTLHITDVLRRQPSCPILSRVVPVGDIDVHSPSAHLHSPRAALLPQYDPDAPPHWADRLNRASQLTLHSTVAPDDAGHLRPTRIAEDSADADTDASAAADQETIPKIRWWRYIPRLLGPLLFILVLTRVDLGQVWAALKQVPFTSILGAAGLCVGLVLVKALRWHLLLRALAQRESPAASLLIYGDATFWGTLTPGRLGEFRKIQYLRQQHGIRWTRGVWFSVLDRLFDVSALLIVFGIGLAGLPASARAILRPEAWTALVIIALAVILLRKPLARRLAGSLNHDAPTLRRAPAILLRDLAVLSLPMLITLTLISVISLLLYVGMIWILSAGLPFELTFFQTAICVASAMFAGILPISFFNLGSREVVLAGLFHVFCLSLANAISLGMLFLLCYFILMAVAAPLAWQADRRIYRYFGFG